MDFGVCMILYCKGKVIRSTLHFRVILYLFYRVQRNKNLIRPNEKLPVYILTKEQPEHFYTHADIYSLIYSFGSLTKNTAPLSSVLSNHIFPPISSTRFFTIGNPSPIDFSPFIPGR
jgi:hypothetical protein